MQRESYREFEQIAFQYMDFLYGQALILTSDMERAEVVIQKTFEKAFNTFKSEHVSDYKIWLLDILKTIEHQECMAG